MTSDAFLILQTVIAQCWRFFTEWHLPGTHATPGEMGMFMLTAVVTLKFFLRVGQVHASDVHKDK